MKGEVGEILVRHSHTEEKKPNHRGDLLNTSRNISDQKVDTQPVRHEELGC